MMRKRVRVVMAAAGRERLDREVVVFMDASSAGGLGPP
jgi:hypothetical protein